MVCASECENHAGEHVMTIIAYEHRLEQCSTTVCGPGPRSIECYHFLFHRMTFDTHNRTHSNTNTNTHTKRSFVCIGPRIV